MFGIVQRKAGLAAYEDKRFVYPDCVNTLAHGHRKTKLDITKRTLLSFMIPTSDPRHSNYLQAGIVLYMYKDFTLRTRG